MKVTVEATHCTDIKCPYLKEDVVYPADSFEMPYNTAECTHPKARLASHDHPCLGASDDIPYDDYCKIPEWCPMIEVAEVPKGPTNGEKMHEIIEQFRAAVQDAFGVRPWVDLDECDLFKHTNVCLDSEKCIDCHVNKWLEEPYDEKKSKLKEGEW